MSSQGQAAQWKMPADVYGTVYRDLQMETGTFDGDVNVGQNGDIPARIWSNTADGEARWCLDKLPKHTGGDVVIRVEFSIGTVGSSGDNTKWRLDYSFFDDGEQYPTSMASSVTVTKDMNGLAVRTFYTIDFTILAANWNRTKAKVCLHLIRLASSDATDNYTAGSFYQHKLIAVYSGYGPPDTVVAPS